MDQPPGTFELTATAEVLPPGITTEEGKWYYEDHEGCVIGPYDQMSEAVRLKERDEDDRLGRKHRASPMAELVIRSFIEVNNAVAEMEEQLSALKAQRKYLGEHEMIEVLSPEEVEQGVRLENGSEWTFEQQFNCSVKNADKPAAYDYLKEQGADDLLKHTVTISLGKNSAESSKELKALISKILPDYEVSVRVGKAPVALTAALYEIIHRAGMKADVETTIELPGSSMRAWVVKRFKLGKEVPDCFGVYAPLQPKRLPPKLPEITEF